MRRRAVFVLAFLLCAGRAMAQARSLSWKGLDVSARLEADAKLGILERHTIVFDGDWNGGERTFRLVAGQQLTDLKIRRIDPHSGAAVPLQFGDPSQVNNYNWSGFSLRWRTRLPSDPPYQNETLIFEIEYAMSGVVYKESGNQYRIDHDFAFPDRPAPIERFTLKFDLDPVWQADPVPPLEKLNLPPGESVVLHLPLPYTAQGEPSFIHRPPPPPPPPKPPLKMSAPGRAGGVAALFLLFSLLVISFFHHEKSIGRFNSWEHLLPSDESWLQRNIFAYPAEVIGAAWDEFSGEAEVSALLARLIQEGKIKSESKKINQQTSMLQLQLMVPRSELQEHEQALVKALFVSGDVTDRAKIRAHYRSTGFDPAAVLRAPMMRKLEHETSRAFGSPATVSRHVATWLVVGIVLTFFIGFAVSVAVVGFSVLAGAILLISSVLASRYRRKLLGKAGAVTVVIPPLLLTLVAALVTHPVAFAICAAEALLLTWYVLRKARWHGMPEFLQWRRNLIAARDWFAFELSRPQPELKDEWTPYLIAFGLSAAMDAWAKSFAGPRAAVTSAPNRDVEWRSTAAAPRIPVKASPPIWTGGGGAFGGAGASGGWAREVTSLAATVAAPRPTASSSSSSSWSSSSSSSSSSSRSSFSSSSSSSRSGGGGGGGW